MQGRGCWYRSARCPLTRGHPASSNSRAMRGTHRPPRLRRLSAIGLLAGALLVIGGLPVPAGASGPPPTWPGVSGEMQISPNDGNVYETVSAAIDPNDPATIVAGADSWVSPYDGSSSYLRPVQVFGTSNAGTSWSSPTSLPPTPTLPYNVSATEGRFPSLAINAAGVTYVGSIAMHGGFHPAHRHADAAAHHADWSEGHEV